MFGKAFFSYVCPQCSPSFKVSSDCVSAWSEIPKMNLALGWLWSLPSLALVQFSCLPQDTQGLFIREYLFLFPLYSFD